MPTLASGMQTVAVYPVVITTLVALHILLLIKNSATRVQIS
jgi:hypothetical protein